MASSDSVIKSAEVDVANLEKTPQPDSSEEDDSVNPNARPACFSSTVTEVLFVVTVTMAIAMSSFLTGMVTVITSYIGNDLHLNNASITWLTAAPNLVAGSFLLFFGRVADLFGRKFVFVGSLLLFAAFSVAAGFANSGIALDCLNAVMGLFSAAAVPAAVGSLGSVYKYPSKRKNYAFACFSAGNPLGFVVGTICSGVATQLFSWRATYWFLAIVYGVTTVVAVFTVPSEPAKEKLTWAAVKDFDILGTVLTVAGIGMLSVALTNGTDAPEGWKTPYVLVLLLVGVALLGAFIWWENRFSAPLMPMWIWFDRNFTLLNVIQGLTFAAFNAVNFWITLFFQRYWADSPLKVAVYLLPLAIMGTIVNVVVGLIMHRVSNKILLWIASICYTIAFLLIALNRSHTSYWAFCFPAFILCVWGADITFNVANMYVMSSLTKDSQSVAGGIFQCNIRLVTTVSLAITTAIFENVQRSAPHTGYYANDPAAPYAAVFWFSTGLCAIALLIVPFVKIGTQGYVQNK